MAELVALFFLFIILFSVAVFIDRLSLSQKLKLVSLEVRLPASNAAVSKFSSISLVSVYQLIKEVVNQPNWFSFKPQIDLEVIFNLKHGTSFFINLPLKYADVVRNQLLAISPRLEVSGAKELNTLKLMPDYITNLSHWRAGPKFKVMNQEKSLMNDLAANLHGLNQNELVVMRLGIKSEPKRLPLKMLKLILGIIKAGFRLIIELAESDARRSSERRYNRSVMQRSRSLKYPDSSLSVSVTTLVATKTKARSETLNLALQAAAFVNGLVKSRSLLQHHAVEQYLGHNKVYLHQFCVTVDALPHLFNFPTAGGIWEEHAKLNMSLELRAGLDANKNKALVLGLNGASAVGLSRKERQTHTLILGGTGMGKSTLLGYSFIQDMANNNGALLMDPHGDLAQQMLKHVPPQRINDVIYIDPTQIHHPVNLNLLELPVSMNSEARALSKDFIAESIISIFRKIFSEDDSGGHRIEYVLRNAIYTAFHVPGATLFTIQKLLTDELYRASVVAGLKDDALKAFWYGEYAKAGSYQRVKMISGVTAKLGRFERSVVVKRMLDNPSSTLNFDQLLAERKILICNFAKGAIGEDNAVLLGMVVLAKLQLAALKRVLLASHDRTAFYLYVDEFELFNAPLFTELISESRKFGIYLTLAEQTTAYQDERESNILMANVGNVIAFRTAAEVDKRRILPLFTPYLTGSDLSNLKPYSCYLRSMGEQAQRPVSFQTVLLKGHGSNTVAGEVIKHSRLLYTCPYLGDRLATGKTNRVPMSKTT